MNEEDGNNRRMLLAAALCLALMVIWPLVFPPPPSPEGAGPGGATSTVAVQAGAPDVQAPTPVETSTVPVGSGLEVSPEPAVERFAFEGAVPVDRDGEVPYVVELTNLGGAVDAFRLPSYKERDADNRATDEPIALATPVEGAGLEARRFGQMAGIDFVGATSFEYPRRPVYEVVERRTDYIKYRLVTPEGAVVEREYQFDPRSFAFELAVSVENRSSRPQKHQLQIATALAANDAMRQGGGFFAAFVPPPDHLEAICHAAGSVEREDVKGLGKGETETYAGDVRWVAVDRQYFLSAIVARDDVREQAQCTLTGREDTARAHLTLPEAELRPGESRRYKFTAYLGVKAPHLLDGVGAELDRAINYTIFGLNLAPLCAALLWILAWIHDLTGSWGVAIVGLTVLVKAILFPLNQRQGKSMRAMSALKPKMDQIREKYPEDKQRQSEEMMRLYREHNVNPASGCLPVLLQMPIWFALYRSLSVSVDLYQEGFLWIDDLTTRDPYWILPVVLTAVMFIQQKMMPAAMDPAQQKVMLYTMPLMFGFLMAALPAGLSFYILVNTLLTVLQQHLINRTIGPPPGPARPAEGAH